MSNSANWSDYILIKGAGENAARFTQFFDRLSRTRVGQVVLAEINRRTGFVSTFLGYEVPFSQFRKPLEIIVKAGDEEYLGRFTVGSREILIDPRAFTSLATTPNLDGSALKFEEVLIHEIVHFLLDDNPGFRAINSNRTIGRYSKFTAGLANRAFNSGEITKAEYDYITAPYKSVVDVETMAESIGNAIYGEVFGPNGSSDYYNWVNRTTGTNSFNYETPLPSTTDAELASIRSLLDQTSAALSDPRTAGPAFLESARRAAEKGLIHPDQLRFVNAIFERYATNQRSSKLRKIDEGTSVGAIYDYFGEIVGVVEYSGETIISSSEYIFDRDSDGRIKTDGQGVNLPPKQIVDFVNGVSSVREVRGFLPNGKLNTISVDILLPGNPIGVDFSQAGAVLGLQLGARLANGNELTSVVYSAALQTLGDNLGDVLDGVLPGGGIGESIETAFSEFGDEFLSNLKSAGIGAVSSYLTAELVNAIGLSGFAGELLNSTGGAVIGQIASNLVAMAGSNPASLSAFSNIGSALGSAAGSFVGAKLASLVWQPDTIGGQIGAAVGSALAPIAVNALLAPAGLVLTPIGVAVVVFVGFLLGGLIGSIFGGTPRSGADASWDSDKNEFVVANVWSRKGGSKDAARGLAASVSDTLNNFIAATGGTLLNPTAVQSGSYGMRKSEFVYRPFGGGSDNGQITRRFDGSSAATDLISYGLYQAFTDIDFQLAGGDVYAKRAFYNTFLIGTVTSDKFDVGVLNANISAAQSYSNYLANSVLIDAVVSTETNSVFAAETLLMLARADELGLTRRHASDWFGGFSFLLRQAETNAAWVEFGLDYDPINGQISRLIAVGDYILGDQIDINGQTTVEGTLVADLIDLRANKLADQRGYAVNGKVNNDIAVTGADFTELSTSVSFAPTDLRKIVTVGIASADGVEATESFLGTLSHAPNMRIMNGNAVATITDGGASLPTLMVGDSFAWEGDGFAVFRLSLSKAASQAVTLSLSLGDTGSARSAAIGDGLDFGNAGASNLQVSADGIIWTNGTTATFAAGVTELFVRTAVISDNVVNPAYVAGGTEQEFLNVEGIERFKLNATVATGAAALANGAETVAGTGTILDGSGNEPLVWIDNVVVDESSGQARFTISRSRALATATTVSFATADRRVLDIAIATTVDGGAGNDTIYASNLGDNIFGGAGNDTLYGGRLDDWLLGGDGNDILDAGTVDQTTLGGDGNYLNGGDGNDTLNGREGSDWLEGGDGTDTLTGGAGDDILVGGAGAGDQLAGGAGDDQYVVRRGDGADIIDETASSAPVVTGAGDAFTQRIAGIQLWKANPFASGAIRPDWVGNWDGVQSDNVASGEDAIVFGYGIEIGDIHMQRSGTGGAAGSDLIIRVMETVGVAQSFSGTQITVKDWFTNPFKRVEWLKFTDGTEIRIGDITSFVIGGAGNDVLIGTSGNDFVFGGAGNDRLFLLAGDDIGNGGTGNDMVAGDAGRDLLIGGLGNDELIGGKGADALSGDDGADDLYGGADDDILSGGRGDGDHVVGGAGNDIFKYSRGDGHDTFADEYVNSWLTVWTETGGWNAAGGFSYNPGTGEVRGPGGAVLRLDVGTADQPDFQWLGRYDYDSVTGTLKVFATPANGSRLYTNSGSDRIEFAPGINIQDVILVRSNDDLVLAISDEDEDLGSITNVRDSVTIKDWYLSPGQIEGLVFAQTGVLDIAATDRKLIAGTDGIDGSMATPLQGTAVNDWITGGSGDDVIAGGNGNDILAGNSGFDTLKGEAGDDVLYGGTGNDVLDGGAGKDILIGGLGEDTASYASASASVRADLAASSGNTGDAAGDEYDSIENLTGGSGADTLGGDEGDNVLTGGRGNDHLAGGLGDDTYVWNIGDGADIIEEGGKTFVEAISASGVINSALGNLTWDPIGEIEYYDDYDYDGNHVSTEAFRYYQLEWTDNIGDTVYFNDEYYVDVSDGFDPPVPSPSTWIQSGWHQGFARTNGQQVTRQLKDYATNGGDDVIEFGVGISLSDLSFLRPNYSDVVIRYGGLVTSQITIKENFGTDPYYEGDEVQPYSLAIESIIFSDGFSVSIANGFGRLRTGRYGEFDDNIVGFGSDDVLVGYAGNDQLSGGNGDDVLEGGAGADILDGGANGTAGDTVRYVGSAAVTIDLMSTGAQSGGDAQGDTLIGVENVVGSQTGADILRGTEGNNRFDGLDGNNQIWGRGGDDVIIAGKGADKLYGDAGDDNIDAGDGNDDVYGGAGKDVLVGGGGNDRIWGQDGDDTILGGDGNDTVLDGGAGNDLVMGNAGDDTLTGGAGDDNLVGGTGNDLLQGGSGNDTYLFDSRSGNDTLVDALGTNVIAFEGNIAIDQLWMVRTSNDLKISVIGGDASITVSNYFASGAPSLLRSISTATHTLYLAYSAPLIAAMTAVGTSVPSRMSSGIAADLSAYWHAGHTAAPTAQPLGLFIYQNTASSATATGAVDHDENIADYSIGSTPANGAVALDAVTGVFTYTPVTSYLGSDRFTIIVTDADGQAVEVPVAVTVAPDGAVQNFPNQFAGNYSFDEYENVAIGTVIGAVAANDPDSAATALGQQSYSFLVNGAASAVSADGIYVIDAGTGEIRTNAALDFDTGTPSTNHTVIARDNAGADGYNQASASVEININDINEEHSLSNASISLIEGDYRPNHFTSGLVVSYNLNELMLADPENGSGLIWEFSDGSNISGSWELNRQTGVLSANDVIDFEGLPPSATQNLSITARDEEFTSSAVFSASIIDRNEGPQLNFSPRFIIRDDQKEGNFATLTGYDPETGAAASSYTITNITASESFHSRGSSSDVRNTGNPTLTIGYSNGVLNFQVPGDGEWEGGIKSHPTLGGRWYYQLDYEVTVLLTDASGTAAEDNFTVTFLKHGTSGVLPIILDLDGDGIELIDHESSTVFFDMDLDGIADRTGWVSADDGMLVLDRNGNGIIDNSLEISFASDDAAAVTDLEGLRAWDTNQNGLIDAGDEAFAQFQVWRDINQNGISDSGELFSLGEMGIRAINLTLNLTGEELVEDRNVLFATSQFFRTNGTIGIVGDVSLAFDPSRTQEGEASEPYDELAPQVSEPVPVADPGNPGEANVSNDGTDAIPEETPGIPDAQGAANDDEAVSGSPDATGDGASVSGLAAPIVFDLDNDGEGLVSLAESRTRFDMNLDGFLDRTGWIEEGDAFLALDRNGNGVIDDISEISFVADKEGARTDLEGLAAFDTNGDGVFDGLDDRFVEFRLWRDGNSNGLTDAGELLSLAEGGITSIALVGTPTGQTPVEGENIVFNTSTYTLSSGETGTLLDAGLAFRAGDGLPDIDFQESNWSGKSKHWRQTANNGSVQITPRRVNGALSADAGLIAPASTYAIGNRNIGTLSTILLDLDGDGLEARRSGKSKAWFDMNGDGVVDDTGWMSGGDGMLVIDRDGNGLINDTSEITFLPENEDATSAWDGLGELDENGDGRISAADTRFGELAVWVDSNQDGISQGDEIRSLTDLGIRDISLNQRSTSDSAKVGNNLALSTSTFTWSSGVTATIGNVALGFEVNPAAPPAAVPMSPGQLSTAMAGARLAEAMSVFGSDASGSITGTMGADKAGTMDWLSVSAA